MTDLATFFARPGRVEIAATPEGHDAFVLGGLVERGFVGTLLYVCRDDGRMARSRQALEFFHPQIEVLTFPAWDCLPYDRVSPNAEIVSRRIDTLTRLVEAGADQRIVLTTVNAALQRVAPRKLFEGRVLRLASGGTMPVDRLIGILARNGYTRTDTVREHGEFAVRGGIVDLYPSGARAPVRLDFFGDMIEGLRSFDALTQRSIGVLDALAVKPVSEVLLDEAAIHRFRSRYREQFGTVADDDPLYEAISAGHRYIGMEHWLPLYYETLETIFDYLPGAALALDHQAELCPRRPAGHDRGLLRSPPRSRRGEGRNQLSRGAARSALPERGAMERDPRPSRRRADLAFRIRAWRGRRRAAGA